MNKQRTPSIRSVALCQVELMMHSKYVYAFLILPLVGLLVMNLIVPAGELPPWKIHPTASIAYVPLVAVGGLAAVFAWINESPRGRRYHWAMPVKREVHDALRILAGAFWLIVSIALFCVIAYWSEGQVMREQWLRHAPIFWLSCFLIPLLTYGILTIPMLVLGQPFLWVLVLTALALFTRSKVAEDYVPIVADVGIALFSAKEAPSLGLAIAGGGKLGPWHNGEDVYRVFNATADGYYRANVPFDGGMSRSIMEKQLIWARKVDQRTPLKNWLQSMAIWYLVAILGISVALKRRPDV